MNEIELINENAIYDLIKGYKAAHGRAPDFIVVGRNTVDRIESLINQNSLIDDRIHLADLEIVGGIRFLFDPNNPDALLAVSRCPQ